MQQVKITEIENLTVEVREAEAVISRAEQAGRDNWQRQREVEAAYHDSVDLDERARLRAVLDEFPAVAAQLERRAAGARKELERYEERLQIKKQEAARLLAALQNLQERTQPGGMYDQMIQTIRDDTARKITELETSKADELAAFAKNRLLYLEMAGPSPDLPEGQ